MARFVEISQGPRWFRDEVTGLYWSSSSIKRDWEDADCWCTSNGGRLPTVQELLSIVDYTKYGPCTPLLDTSIWSAAGYWSGTHYVGEPGNAWGVYFSDGRSFHAGKSAYHYVRAVRDS